MQRALNFRGAISIWTESACDRSIVSSIMYNSFVVVFFSRFWCFLTGVCCWETWAYWAATPIVQYTMHVKAVMTSWRNTLVFKASFVREYFQNLLNHASPRRVNGTEMSESELQNGLRLLLRFAFTLNLRSPLT